MTAQPDNTDNPRLFTVHKQQIGPDMAFPKIAPFSGKGMIPIPSGQRDIVAKRFDNRIQLKQNIPAD